MAEPIVFLPDMLCDARLFGPQLAALSVDYATMSVPLAHSEHVSDMVDQVLSQAPQRFALAGCGLGGVVAMDIAARAPDRVSRMALIATSPLQESPFGSVAYEEMLVSARVGRLQDVVAKLFSVTAQDQHGQLLPLLLDMADHIGLERFISQVRVKQRHRDMHSVLRKCSCPVQVICGQDDTLIPVKRHQVMTEFFQDGALTVVPSAAHVPTLENPNGVTQALRDWMARPLMLR